MGFDEPQLALDIQAEYDNLPTVPPLKTTEEGAQGLAAAINNNYVEGVPTSEPWVFPSLIAPWVNYDGVRLPRYYKDPTGVVRIYGVIKLGVVGVSAFPLLPGYRPSATYGVLTFPVFSNNGLGAISVYPTGDVIPLAPSDNAWVFLEPIAFRAEG